MIFAYDGGFTTFKSVWGYHEDTRAAFPSVTGEARRSRINLGDEDTPKVLVVPSDGEYLFGDSAVRESIFAPRHEDRSWFTSKTYRRLLLASLCTATSATQPVSISVATGLPISEYERDRKILYETLMGTHRAGFEGRHTQTFHITEVRVLMQAVGALLSVALSTTGRLTDSSYLGEIAVIDCGGRNINFLSVANLRDVEAETASRDFGAWSIVQSVRDHLKFVCPDLVLHDHQVISAAIRRQIDYYGEAVDLSRVVDEALYPLAEEAAATARVLWKRSLPSKQMVFNFGGGALLFGPLLKEMLGHKRFVIAQDPVFANALGYYKILARGVTGS